MRFCGFLSLLLHGLSAHSYPLMTLKTQSDLARYLEKRNFSGVVLVTDHGNVKMRQAFGKKSIKTNEPITVSDKFQIGSCTKQMVAAALLQLQEKGLLSTSDLISKYIQVPASYNAITIRDVLNHSSGIPNYTEVDHGRFWKERDLMKMISLDEVLSFSYKYPLDFEPKKSWSYSNTGYIIAGKIIEIITGKTWDRYLVENIFTPLQMTNTGYEEFFDRVSDVVGYVFENDNLVEAAKMNLSWAASAGAVYSTVDDLAKWAETYSTPAIISDESLKEMTTPFLEDYALGVFATKLRNGDTLISHSGRTPGFTTNVSHLQKSDMSFIKLDNTDGSSVTALDRMLIGLFTQGSVRVPRPERTVLSEDALKEYVGKYSGAGMELEVYLQKGKLYLFPKGQRPFLLEAIEKDNFELIGVGAEEFLRNEQGIITGIKHYQGGGESVFDRL